MMNSGGGPGPSANGGGVGDNPNGNGNSTPQQQMQAQQAAQQAHQQQAQFGLMGGGGAGSHLSPMMGANGGFPHQPSMSLGSLNPQAFSQMAGLVGANLNGGGGMPGMMAGGMNSPGQPNAALLMAAMQGNNSQMNGMAGQAGGVGASNPMNALLNPNLMQQAAAALMNNSALSNGGGPGDNGVGSMNGGAGPGGMGQMNPQQQLQQHQQNLQMQVQQQQQQQNMQMQQMMMQQMQQQMQSNPVLSGIGGMMSGGPLNSLQNGTASEKGENKPGGGLPPNALSSLFPSGGLGGMGSSLGNPSGGGEQSNPLGALMPQSMMGGGINPILSGNSMGSMGLGGGMGMVGSDMGMGSKPDDEVSSSGLGSSGLGAPVSDCQYRDYSNVADESAFSSRNGSMMSSAKSKSNASANFPSKLHEILSRDDITDIIAWAPHGRSWRVLKPKAFEEKIIPQYFRHGKYNSFTRQVNGWGFRRITQGPDHNSYYHEFFLRGLPHLCKRMRRLTAAGLSKNDNISRTEPDFYRLAKLAPLSGEMPSNNDNDGSNTQNTKVESNSDIAPKPASQAGGLPGVDDSNSVSNHVDPKTELSIKQEDFAGALAPGLGDKNASSTSTYINSLQQLNSMQHLLQAQYNTSPYLLNQDKKGAGSFGMPGMGGAGAGG
eukprot:CAMPEP_0194448074 /NCGR_PEP_ID=MMETSP0176-20130528/129364_1 /TAXON_ID=216777 /ORGANISM="Proboscia alata, Strain PI-D3" /LENGTH=657 /DNA_ID=CAMNT_0039275009 /DNA_START=1023 /DNA_END=2992 /DNA_ORIENTATION=+